MKICLCELLHNMTKHDKTWQIKDITCQNITIRPWPNMCRNHDINGQGIGMCDATSTHPIKAIYPDRACVRSHDTQGQGKRMCEYTTNTSGFNVSSVIKSSSSSETSNKNWSYIYKNKIHELSFVIFHFFFHAKNFFFHFSKILFFFIFHFG